MTIAEQLAEIMFKDKYENKVRESVKQSLIQIAIKALKKGADVSFVADITSLSIEQVQTIKTQHNL